MNREAVAHKLFSELKRISRLSADGELNYSLNGEEIDEAVREASEVLASDEVLTPDSGWIDLDALPRLECPC